MTYSSIGIIGIGNPLRKDDGIGLILLDYIKKDANDFPKTVSFVDGGTGGMNLLHVFNRFDLVILLDAVHFEGTPGHTRFFTFNDIQNKKKVSTVSTHNADLFQIIRLGQKINECPKNIFVFGVQPADVSYGKGLTKPLQDGLENIVVEMKKQIYGLIDLKKK
jgi:hydrogenase maturation protease